MFKSGQLVQSIKYGDYYLIISRAGPGYADAKPLSKKRWPLPTMMVEHDRFRLVGNNFQPKGINKALREVRTS